LGIVVEARGANISDLQKCVQLRERGHAHKKKIMWVNIGGAVLVTALGA